MKLYVIVRRDLPWAVRTVQGVHAATNLVAKWCPDSSEWGQYGPHLVLLGVEDRHELADIALTQDAEAFYEPDMGDQLTAIAFFDTEFMDARARLL